MLPCPDRRQFLHGSPLNAKAFRGFFISAQRVFIKKVKPNGNILNNRNTGGGMAYILRLIVICFAFGIVSPGYAETVQKITQYAPSIMSPLVWSNSGSAACSVGLTERKKSDDEVYHYVAGSPFYKAPTTCNVDRVNFLNEVNKGSGSFTLVTRLACPTGSTENPDGSCSSGQCPAGMQQNSSGACVCKPGMEIGPDGICQFTEDHQCKTFYALGNTIGGRFTQEYRLTGNISDGSKFCMPGQFENANRGCVVVFDRMAAFSYGSESVTEGKFDGKPGDTGLACTVGTGDTPAIPKPEKCPNGYTGTVNGVEVCVGKVPDSGVEPGSSDTTVDDGTNTTNTRTNSNTTCENGRCTTTTTVTTTVTNNASGTSTSSTNSTTTTQSHADFCKANAKASLCGGSGLPNVDGGGSGGGGGNGDEEPSSFTGACAGGFQCKGDAIQCAIAREQHIRACRLFDKESPESKLYEEFKGKEGDQTKDLPGNETFSINDKINTSDALGAGGAGLSDLSLTVWNQQVTLPLSMLNQYLAALGNVLLAVSFLLAFRIVARG